MSQAVLYVELVPTTKGIKRTIEKEIAAPFGEAQGKADGFFSKLGSGVRGVATAVAGVFATVSAFAVGGGLSRLLNVEDAQAKLKGLGHDAASVDLIMSNALASVKGTAFGLDEAATIAASAVASGIKPGQELERYLRLTADAATIAGGSLDELGSVMNDVTTLGAAYNDSLQILARKGLPIYQWLADEMGTTTDAVKQLASEGKISAETFQAAIEKNIGGAALSAGDTTRGAFANMLTAIKKVGENLLSGVFPQFKTTFGSIQRLFEALQGPAEDIGAIIGNRLAPAFSMMQALIKEGIPDLSALSGALGPLVGVFAALGASGLGSFLAGIPGLGGLAGPLTALGSPIGLIAGALAGLIAVSPELQAALGGVLGTIGAVFGEVMSALAPLLPAFASLAEIVAGVLAGAIQSALPFIMQLVPLIGDLLTAGITNLMPLLESVGALLSELGAALFPVISELLAALMPAIAAVTAALMPMLGALLPVVATLIDALAPILVTVAELIGTLLTPILGLVTEVITALTPVIQFLVEFGINALMAAITFLMPVIEGVVNALGSILVPVIDVVIGVIRGLIDFVVNVFQGNWEKAWGAIVGVFKTIFEGMGSIVRGVINGVIDLINGFLNGLDAVGGFLSDITGGTIGFEIGTIPHLADGALISATPGGSIVRVGEGRYDEAVLPLGGPRLEEIRNAISGGEQGSRREVKIYPTFEQQDPELQMRLWMSAARRAV